MAPTHSPASHLTVKKKFLLANKHITKSVLAAPRSLHPLMAPPPTRLNSTLSLRIEELNAQISALHVENLRLRTSEIALGSQLKKEREKSQRLITDAESAVRFLSLPSHLLLCYIVTFSRNSHPFPLLVILILALTTSMTLWP